MTRPMIYLDDALKVMGDYHWNRYATRDEGGTLFSPAVFTSHTWQEVQDAIRALPVVTVGVKPLVWDADGRILHMDDTIAFSKSYDWDGWDCFRQEGYGSGAGYIIWPDKICSEKWNLYGTADGLFVTELHGEEAAKAAAEADWQAKGRSIITAPEPQPVQPAMWPEKDAVTEASSDGKGFWKSCSGCHELNEGHATGPVHPILQCHVGVGCYECGGIGAVWDMTDYADLGEYLSRPSPDAQVAPPQWEFDAPWSASFSEALGQKWLSLKHTNTVVASYSVATWGSEQACIEAAWRHAYETAPDAPELERLIKDAERRGQIKAGAIFANYGTNEADYADAVTNACPYCGGSGHKDDVTPAPDAQAIREAALREAASMFDADSNISQTIRALIGEGK